MGDLNVQREYISRMIEVPETKIKSKGAQDRRKCTKKYFLQLGRNQRLHVCQKMFLNTLAISEKTTRTALDKEQATGVLIQDQRGGRTENQAELDAIKRQY